MTDDVLSLKKGEEKCYRTEFLICNLTHGNGVDIVRLKGEELFNEEKSASCRSRFGWSQR